MFRREFGAIPELIATVPAGDTGRARLVADHLNFIADARPEIERMEEQHAGIAAAMDRAHSVLGDWTKTADRGSSERLLASVAELSRRVVEHLDDEERVAVPIIEEHLTVMGGLVLDYASLDERQSFLAGLPVPHRFLLKLLSPRMTASYRRRLYGSRN